MKKIYMTPLLKVMDSQGEDLLQETSLPVNDNNEPPSGSDPDPDVDNHDDLLSRPNMSVWDE